MGGEGKGGEGEVRGGEVGEEGGQVREKGGERRGGRGREKMKIIKAFSVCLISAGYSTLPGRAHWYRVDVVHMYDVHVVKLSN